jgi:hypothetical protein
VQNTRSKPVEPLGCITPRRGGGGKERFFNPDNLGETGTIKTIKQKTGKNG